MDVSVVIAAFNAAGMIGDTLSNITAANRTGLRLEIIVVDNNSADNTAEVVESLADRHLCPSDSLALASIWGAEPPAPSV